MARRLSILVVDDDSISLKLADALFRSEGHDVRCLSDPRQVPAAFRPPPDLVLLDVNMPGLDGDDVIRLLKKALPQRTPPLVLISNLPVETLRERARAAAADHYLTKPLSRFQVQDLIRNFFGA